MIDCLNFCNDRFVEVYILYITKQGVKGQKKKKHFPYTDHSPLDHQSSEQETIDLKILDFS